LLPKERKMTVKRLISVLLAVVLLFGIIMPVFAGTPEYDAGVEDNDFGSAIGLVAMTVPEPKAGKPVAEAVLTPVAGAKFTVKYQWLDKVTMAPVETTTFQAGGRYRLEFEAIPNVAYWFEASTEVCINDVYCGYQSQERRSIKGYMEWDLFEFVREVYFPAFPVPQLGDAGTIEIPAPDHGKYTYTCYYMDPYTWQPAKTLEEGRCYLLQMTARNNPGYEFTPGTKVYVDGKLFDGLCDVGGHVTVTKIVSFGLKTENNVHIEIAKPQADTPLATSAQALTEGFTVGEFIHWYPDVDGDFSTGHEPSATVAEEGKFYYVQFYAYAADGYALAENLDIQVNGKPAKILELENYGAYCRVVVNMGRVGELPGDLNEDGFVTTEDVVALLLNISMPDMFPLDKPADFTGDGEATTEDAVKLLLHISMPDMFPLISEN